MNKITIIYTFLLVLIVSACQHKPQHNKLIGSWQVEKINWISKERTASIEDAQPGLFIFTENSYSIQWTPIQQPRIPFKILSKPTDEEFITGFKSVVFNAGSYVYTDSTITATAFIAKVPGFEGGQQLYSYEMNEETLTLTMFDEVYPDGAKPDWSGKWSTQFILKRKSY